MSNEEQLKIYAEPITSLYYVRTKIPDDLLIKINEDIDHLLLNKEKFETWNSHLAGNLAEEYKFPSPSSLMIEEFSLRIAENYFQVLEDEKLNPAKKFHHPPDFFDKPVSYELESLWINLQKKYEFNPNHNHSGDYSFVIWIRIPYNLEDELNCANSRNANEPCNSLFEFCFLSSSGDIQSLPLMIDKSWEGTMVMFPSWLNHTVYPFYTSDDYRISISGNINVNLSIDE